MASRSRRSTYVGRGQIVDFACLSYSRAIHADSVMGVTLLRVPRHSQQSGPPIHAFRCDGETGRVVPTLCISTSGHLERPTVFGGAVPIILNREIGV